MEPNHAIASDDSACEMEAQKVYYTTQFILLTNAVSINM